MVDPLSIGLAGAGLVGGLFGRKKAPKWRQPGFASDAELQRWRREALAGTQAPQWDSGELGRRFGQAKQFYGPDRAAQAEEFGLMRERGLADIGSSVGSRRKAFLDTLRRSGLSLSSGGALAQQRGFEGEAGRERGAFLSEVRSAELQRERETTGRMDQLYRDLLGEYSAERAQQTGYAQQLGAAEYGGRWQQRMSQFQLDYQREMARQGYGQKQNADFFSQLGDVAGGIGQIIGRS